MFNFFSFWQAYEREVLSFLSKKFQGKLAKLESVAKEDLDLVSNFFSCLMGFSWNIPSIYRLCVCPSPLSKCKKIVWNCRYKNRFVSNISCNSLYRRTCKGIVKIQIKFQYICSHVKMGPGQKVSKDLRHKMIPFHVTD